MSEKPKKSTGLRLNLWILSMARNWLKVALVIVGLYATLPFVAPTLMKIGATGPANVLYTLYSPMCHQFAFRSVFLYGEQPFYPREVAGTEYVPYETVTANSDDVYGEYRDDAWFREPDVTTGFARSLWEPARAFRGNETLGYKTTLCARDVAIYVALFIGGLIYSIPNVRRHIRPIPLILWAIIGVGPIAIDGFSQLLSYEPFTLWPVRETAPFFRVATGAFFGLMNAWLGFPYLDAAMRDTQYDIERKLIKAGYGDLLREKKHEDT